MKSIFIATILCLVGGITQADEKRQEIITFDAGQALFAGALLDSTLLIFSYEKPLGITSGQSNSLRFSLYTGTLCPFYCWDYTALGAELRTYTTAYANGAYYSYDAIAGSHERDGFVAGVNVGLGYTTRLGESFVIDPYFKAGTVGLAFGVNLGVMF